MGTALIYDEEMTKYKLLWVDPACKIEVPERLTVSHQALIECGLADRCVPVPVRQATDEEILLVHSLCFPDSEKYLEAVKKTPYMTLEDLQAFTLQYDDVYFHPNIYHCAKLAVGAALQLVDSIMTGKVRNGMALVRPPGHHSMRSAANGFCVFNNVAIAAHYAKQKYGLKRVLIVDWDIHHGQGIQYCFENDPSVLYFSWHRYEHQKFWPNLRESDYDAVGKDKGVGFNVNVPWNKVGMTNSDFLTIFCHILLPVAYEFGPDLVLVCAGFDSAIGDPEGEMSASPDVFAHLTHLLMNLAGGKLCALLEGGYNLTSLPQSVCQTVQTLLGDPAPPSANLSGPCRSAIESLHCVRSAHRPYWSCFSHAAEQPTFDISTKRAKLTEADAPQASEEEKKHCTAVAEWPEPPQRVAPLVRTAAVLPDGIECPDRCQRFRSSEDPNPSTVRKIRDIFFKDGNDSGALQTFVTLTALVEKMLKHEVGSGLALISNVAAALACIAQHTAAALNKRVLVVCVGDMMELIPDTEDGKTVLVHFSSKEADEQKGEHQVPVCLKKGCSDVPGFMQAVLSLLLPLGYEFNPSLVLLVRLAGSDVCDSAWQQLTCLLQGLAQGHTLVLMPEEEKSHVATTVSCLLGDAAAPLGPLRSPLADHMEALERLRHSLQNKWKLLRTITTGNGEFPEP